MKKKLLILTLVVCAIMVLGSGAVFAADLDGIPAAKGGSNVAVATPSEATPSAWTCPYDDVLYSDWHYNYVRFMTTNGMMNGYSSTVFAPNDSMTRAMVVTVLYRLDGSPYVSSAGSFYDVPYGEWYSAAVEWAAANGIVNGMGNGSFAPNAKVTREQFVTMLYRYANYKGYNTSASAALPFPDAAKLSSYAYSAMKWAVAEGIIGGSQVGNALYLIPGDSSTRAQVAKMLSVFAVEYIGSGKTDSLELDYESYDTYVGASVRIYNWVTPVNAYAELNWTSSNPSVATVSRGVVLGVSRGTATITASTHDGRVVSAKVNVHYNAYDCLANVALSYGDKDSVGDYGFLEGNEDGAWYYEEGFYYSTQYDQVMLYTSAYNESQQFGYETQIWLNANTKTHQIYFYYNDYEYDAYLYGAPSIYAPNFTPNSKVKFPGLYYTNGTPFYDSETESYLTKCLNDDIHFLLGDLEFFCDYYGIGCDLKDLGFTKY